MFLGRAQRELELLKSSGKKENKMKVKVKVNRTGYSNNTFEIELPSMPYKKFNDMNKNMQKKLMDIIEEKAIDEAGGHSFSEHSSEYELENFEIIEEPKDKKGI